MGSDDRRRGAWARHGLAIGAALLVLGPIAAPHAATADAEVDGAAARESGSGWRFGALYTGEYLHNLRGGAARGGAYLDNLDLTLEVDGERAFGLPGLSALAYGLYNNGGSISGRYVGDTHTVSNIEAPGALRLYELWVDYRFGAARARSLRVGLYDLNSEFDASEVAALFISGAQGIGIDFSQAGLNGPSIFPFTSLAARLDWRLGGGWALRAAALDGVPGDPQRPTVTTVKLGDGDGALYVAELEHRSETRRFVVGHWRFTTAFDDLVELDAAGDPRRRDGSHGSHGSYALVEGDLWRSSAGARRLTGVARIGVASPDVNPVEATLRLGLVMHAPFGGSDGDQAGIAVATYRNGDPYLAAGEAAGAPLTRGETNVELTYRLAINGWLTLQPNLQWIADPGSDPQRADSWVIGLRFEVGGASH